MNNYRQSHGFEADNIVRTHAGSFDILYNPIVCDGRCGIIKKILNYNSRLIVFIRTALGESQAIAFEKYWHSPPNIAIFNWETKIKIRIHQFVKYFSMSYYFKKISFGRFSSCRFNSNAWPRRRMSFVFK